MGTSKIITENPLIDEVIHNTKILASQTILKDADEAYRYETVDSRRIGDIYISCKDNRAEFELFDYNITDIKALTADTKKIKKIQESGFDKKVIKSIFEKPILNIFSQTSY